MSLCEGSYFLNSSTSFIELQSKWKTSQKKTRNTMLHKCNLLQLKKLIFYSSVVCGFGRLPRADSGLRTQQFSCYHSWSGLPVKTISFKDLKPQIPVLLPANWASIRENFGIDDLVPVTNISVSVTLANAWFCGKFSNMVQPLIQYADKVLFYHIIFGFLWASIHLFLITKFQFPRF